MADIYAVTAEDDATGEPVQIRVEFEGAAQRLVDVMDKSDYFNEASYDQVF